MEQSDNNVQKATEKLLEQGYEKRNPTGPIKTIAKEKKEEEEEEFKLRQLKSAPTPPPRMKSLEEKNKSKWKIWSW